MNCLLVLDRIGYKKKNVMYKNLLLNYFDKGEIIYTKYEDEIIRKVRNWPFVGNFLLHMFRWGKSFKYAFKMYNMKNIETIICLNPIVGMIYGLLPRKKNVKKVIVCGFLFENKNNKLYFQLRKIIAKKSIKNISKVIVYSSSEVDYYSNLFSINDKFTFVPYGIDYAEIKDYDCRKLPDEYIFSGGGSNRDYLTLIKSYNNLKETSVPLVIATQPWRLNGMDTSKCVVLPDVVNETFGDVMKRSKFMVLSLKDENISAGHMVMLQALSLGVPIIVNKISAIQDYVDESVVTFYETGNVEQLSGLISRYLENIDELTEKSIKGKRLYEKCYTSVALVDRLIAL